MKPASLTLEEAREARDKASLELETVKAQTAVALLRSKARPLLEAYDSPPRRDEWAYSDPVTDYRRPRWTSRTLRQDRRNGKYFPAYETEVDLAQMRADSRLLATFDAVAVGALKALTYYVLGSGPVVEVQSREGQDAPESLVQRVQAFVDEFLRINRFSGGLERMDRELHNRSREDGECFVELYREGDQVLLDLREPDEVTEPARKRDLDEWLVDSGIVPNAIVPSWSFGILTDYKRTSVPWGYHVVCDDVGNDWDVIPANRMVHVKRNVSRKAKRGVSDFLCTGPDLENHTKLKRNIGEGAAIQAAIAFIREHVPGQTQSDIEAFVSTNATAEYDRTAKTSTRTVQVEQLRPGTVKDIPAGMKYHAGPLGTLTHPVFVEVSQYIMRIAGVYWTMPEYIVSGDASNANFASTLVAESPFVKARESDQGDYGPAFEEILWKALRLAWEIGRIGGEWETIWQTVEINVGMPDVASRDKLNQAQANEILYRNRALSLRTWQVQSDLDPDEERQNQTDDGDQPMQTGTQGGAPVAQQGAAVQDVTLNGAQIQAAAEILNRVALQALPFDAATELMVNLGIPRDRAEFIVQSQKSVQALPPEKMTLESMAERRSWLWRGYP